MEKRKVVVPVRHVSSRSGFIEFDIDNVDSIHFRRKHNWKRFSFIGFLLFTIVLLIFRYGKPPSGSHRLKHDYQLETPLSNFQLPSENSLEVIPKPSSVPAVITETHEVPATKENRIDELQKASEDLIEKLRTMKQHGTVMETNTEAKLLINKLQIDLRELVVLKYGPEPYFVEMKLSFPDSMINDANQDKEATIVLELAPLSMVPYCVYNFLNIIERWKVIKFSFDL